MKEDIAKLSDKRLYALLNEEKDAVRDEAFAELYSRYARGIYAYCRRILGSERLAEDAFQETFLTLLKSPKKDKVMSNFNGFLIRIARNICLNEKRRVDFNLGSIENLDLGIEDDNLERSEISKLVVGALEALTDAQKESVVLQLYNDMTYEEIASFLDLPVSTVRNRVARGKRMVRKILAPYFEKEKHK